MTRSHILTVRGAMRRFEGGHAALRGADLDVTPGKVTALLGPSGSGKSTLLRAIAGLETLDTGEIHLGETVWCRPGLHVPPETRRVGLVFQDYALFPHLTALDNVAFGLTGQDRKARAQAQLEAAELGDKARNYPHELSGGEQQRVALARALAPEPGLVLLDEPFSGLDSRLRADIRRRTMQTLRRSGAAVLLVTHDAEEALEAADALALMHQGQIIQTGAPQDVWFNPVSAAAARLVGEVNIAPGRVEAGRVQSVFGALDAHGLADGKAVDILIRPDGLRVMSGDGFTVTERAYAGASVRLIAEDRCGRAWTLTTTPDQAPPEGAVIGLQLDRDFLRITPQA